MNDDIYHRENTYHTIGFADMFFSDDYALIDDDAANAPHYYTFLSEKLSGGKYNDDYLSDLIIKLHQKKNKESDSPLFLLAVTMENHQPYIEERNGGPYPFNTTANLTDEARVIIGNAARGIRNSTLAFLKVVDYFRSVDEPTVIFFYGDHGPGLGTQEGVSVYRQLGVLSQEVADWTVEEIANVYSTNYLIWANDPNLLNGYFSSDAPRIESSQYLGLDILEIAGLDMPYYWKFLKNVNSHNAFYSRRYSVSSSNVVYDPSNPSSIDPIEAEYLDTLRSILLGTYS
jgi:hypothetical protein